MVTQTSRGNSSLHGILSWCVKLPLVLIALTAIGWSVYCLPLVTEDARLAGVRDHILRNIPVTETDLLPLIPLLERSRSRKLCSPRLDRDVAIIRLRLAENAFSPDRIDQIDPRMAELERAVQKSLSCAPADPYLWLVLFWVRNTRSGLSADSFDLLRMSYNLGPNEAWIARKRGLLALAMFDALPPDLKQQAVSEFNRLLKSELYTEAIELMAGPGWAHRRQLLTGAVAVPERNKAIFAKAMGDLGYELGPGWARRTGP